MLSSRRSLRLLVPVLAGLAVALAAARALRGEATNVVLVTIDTLRPDHLGCYGHPRGTSPAIDRLATQSTGFTTTLVPRGQTWPTLASIHTSLYPVTHGLRKNGQALPKDALTLAHVLRGEGYACAASLANAAAAEWPEFEIVCDARTEDQKVHEAAVRWLRGHAGDKFFLWIHYFAPHKPFQPPAPYVELYDPGYEGTITGSIEEMQRITASGEPLPARDLRHLIARYDGEIRWLNGLIANLAGTLRELGLEEETLLVLTSDHGEELYERNRYFHHSASVYDTVLRAPLLFRWPGTVPAGRWVEGITEAIDVAPTILDLIGVKAPAGFEGRSLVPAIQSGRAHDPGRAAFAELEDRVVSVRTDEWRFVHNPTDFDFPLGKEDYRAMYPIAKEELYAHREDPRERVDVSASHPETVRELCDRVTRWQEAHLWEEASRRHVRRGIPPEVRESLEALGYVP